MNKEIEEDARVLIISWSPVPTPKYQKIEGSGQRFYGLATGLRMNGVKDITIAVGGIYPLDVKEVDGIKLFNYDFNTEFIDKLSTYDTVIFNYAIHGAKFIADNLPKNTQVIIDAYGPAYIESLARNPEDLVGTYVGNLSAVNEVFNNVLPRGDYFLYANSAQEKFYTGVLATLGVINQFSYHTQRLLRVPFGIDMPDKKVKYDNPYTEYGVTKDDFVLLWFGGLYPWFDITKILRTLKKGKNKKIKFVIVGGNNPQNQHPDFIKHYHKTVDYIKSNNLENNVVLIEWADYTTRRKYYEHADAIISINGTGRENEYSWRTRVMDYVGSTTPLITNGGDPLSDELIEEGAAFKISYDEKSIQNAIEGLLNDRDSLVKASENMHKIQPKYYWKNVTKELSEKIKAQSKPFSDERRFRQKNGITDISTHETVALTSVSKYDAGKLFRRVARKIKSDGFRATSKIIGDKVRRRLVREYRTRFPVATLTQEPRIIIVSNQLNNTGAPFVIMDVIHKLKKQHRELINKIKFIAFTPIESANVTKLENDGVDVEVYTNRELALDFHIGDIVVFNTFAISRTMALSVIDAIKKGVVKKLYWYGHEHSPDGFIDDDIKREIKSLLKVDKVKIYSVSEATLRQYVEFFGISRNIKKMSFPFLFPANKWKVRSADDFNELKFITTGSLMDMRKGQYPILYAFLDFYHNYYKLSPEDYRNFNLEFIGAYEKSDLGPNAAYHVKNIKKQFEVSASGLGERFSITPTLSHEAAIKKIEDANITICYSLYEALGIFVYEGMATGHPIIRNESAGQEEQLIDGKNGYAVSSSDFAGLVDVLETVLNKHKTSNEKLAKMSKISNEIAQKATSSDYFIIDDIYATFHTKQRPRKTNRLR